MDLIMKCVKNNIEQILFTPNNGFYSNNLDDLISNNKNNKITYISEYKNINCIICGNYNNCYLMCKYMKYFINYDD